LLETRCHLWVAPNDNTVIALAQPSYSEMDGWMFSYDIQADEWSFTEFRQTGTLQVKLGENAFETTWTAGLDAISKFQASCMKQEAR
jgi:hypothetical protein